MKKRITAILLLTAILANTYAVNAENTSSDTEISEQSEAPLYPYLDATENIYSVKYTLSDGLDFKRIISSNDSYGYERGFVLEYTPNEQTQIAFATNEYLYKTDTIKKIAEKAYPDKNFVAGINADFFNMSTGVPESAFINDGILLSSDRDSFCLAQREDGTFFIDKPRISMKMLSSDEVEYTILSLNKEFTRYGLYMYTDKYSPTTHISDKYTAVTLLSYEDCLLFDEAADTLDDEEIYEKYCEYLDQDPIEGRPDIVKNELVSMIEEKTEYQLIDDKFYLIKDIAPQIGKSEKLVVSQVNFECTNTVIPSNAYYLCADDTSYGYILMAMSVGDTFELQIDGNESFYDVKNAIGTGTVIVKDGTVIDDRTFSHYTSLQPRSAVGIKSDGTLVFYAVDGRQKNYSAGLKLSELAETMISLDCVYAANLDGGGSTAVSASLPGYDGAITVSSPSGGTERKISNAVIFLNELEKVGTPQSAYSYADYYLTLADWHIDLNELVYADENGFSANFETDNELKNDNENFDENAEATDDISDDTVAEKVAADTGTVLLYTKDGTATVSDGVVFPNGYVGEIEVFASLDGENENLATVVKSIENPDEISLSLEKYEIAPFETAKIKIESFYKKFSVASDFSSFAWTAKKYEPELSKKTELSEEADAVEFADENENIDADEITQPEEIDETYLYGLFENGEFVPIVNDTELVITASRGDISESVRFKIFGYPFADMENHWAVKEIYTLEKLGVVNGQLDENGTAFYLPQRSYSRYEFCVMLERITGIGSKLEIPERALQSEGIQSELQSDDEIYEIILDDTLSEIEECTDEPTEASRELPTLDLADAESIPDWAYSSVYRIYTSGILDDILQTDDLGNTVLNGSEPITREDVMLVLGRLCETAPEDFSLDEYTDLTDEQKNNEFIKNVIFAEIFSGYEDLSLRLTNNLTRAEATAVFVRLLPKLENPV